MPALSIDYTSRDYEGFRTALLEYAKVAFPEWQPSSEGDFGVLMLELLAYVGDVNAYYIDRAQNEAYLSTASQRDSLLRIASLLGYKVGTGTPAKGTVIFQSDSASETKEVLIPAGTRLVSEYLPEIDGSLIFETDSLAVLPAAAAGAVSVTPGIAVTEGETQRDPITGEPIIVASSTGLPFQEYLLPHNNVYQDTVRVFVDAQEWRVVEHLLDHNPEDFVVEVTVSGDNRVGLRFGDNINGTIPSNGLSIKATYRTGYGAIGNLGEGKVISMFDSVPGVVIQPSATTSGASTSSTMSGGANPETNEEIRKNAPKTFLTQNRAVTLKDFENLATSVTGVAKAAAVSQYYSSVTVYLIGSGGTAVPTSVADVVRDRLQSQALAGVTVSVATPVIVPVNFGIDEETNMISVTTFNTYANSVVKSAVEQAVRNLLAFQNTDLGQRFTVSDVYREIMAVEGVRSAQIPVMYREGADPTGSLDIQCQPWEYPVIGNLFVTVTGGIG